jgi:transcriptional regulator with XRE-family HTH domain
VDSQANWSELLRSFRQRNKLKQEAAASLLGVSQAYVSKVENGAVQPSASLLKRLSVLSRQPQHRPTLDLIKSAVRHLPALTCLFRLVDGEMVVEESSRAFFDFGHPFANHPRCGLVDFDIFGGDAADTLKAAIAVGAFEGRFGMIEAVWSTVQTDTHHLLHFKTVLLPLRTDDDEWLLQATSSEISASDLNAAMGEWNGRVRFFEHDEEPPYTWP